MRREKRSVNFFRLFISSFFERTNDENEKKKNRIEIPRTMTCAKFPPGSIYVRSVRIIVRGVTGMGFASVPL